MPWRLFRLHSTHFYYNKFEMQILEWQYEYLEYNQYYRYTEESFLFI